MAATGLAEVTTPAQRGLQVCSTHVLRNVLVLTSCCCARAVHNDSMHAGFLCTVLSVCCRALKLANASACQDSATYVRLHLLMPYQFALSRCRRRCGVCWRYTA